MCLGIPGKLVEIAGDQDGMAMGRVSFSGIIKEVCLACVPEAQPGDYVIVHAGFAISQVDEAEAERVFEYLREMDQLEALEGEDRLDTPEGEDRLETPEGDKQLEMLEGEDQLEALEGEDGTGGES